MSPEKPSPAGDESSEVLDFPKHPGRPLIEVIADYDYKTARRVVLAIGIAAVTMPLIAASEYIADGAGRFGKTANSVWQRQIYAGLEKTGAGRRVIDKGRKFQDIFRHK